MKLKKKKKSVRMRGHGRGTHGWGARKKHLGSGHRGGVGMAGTGKRADHRKSFVLKKYGTGYFGKQGETSKSTRRKKDKFMNLDFIEKNIETLKKKFSKKNNELDFSEYKILGDGEISLKLNIIAKAASKSAKEKIEKAGGTIIIKSSEEKEKEEN